MVLILPMWKRQRKNGSWKFTDTYKNPLTQKWQEVSCTFDRDTRQTEKEAQFILNEKIKDKLRELALGNSDITFKRLSDIYLEKAKDRVAYHTYQNRYGVLNQINAAWGEDILAKNINTQFLNKYLDDLLYKKKLKNETVRHYRDAISVVYKTGLKFGYVSENPVKNVQISYKKEDKFDEIENKYLEPEEMQAILDDCSERNRPDFRDFFEWMYLTGMRCGEAAVIQKKNIFQENGIWYARVEGTLIKHQNEPDIKKRFEKSSTTKSFAGLRNVVLSPKAIKLAKDHCQGKEDDEYIFTNQHKDSLKVFQAMHLDRTLKSIAKRKHIKKTLLTHIFRHTYVSVLSEMEIPLYQIQKQVGHSDSAITRRIYTHITHKAEQDLANNLENFPSDFRPNKESTKVRALRVVDK